MIIKPIIGLVLIMFLLANFVMLLAYTFDNDNFPHDKPYWLNLILSSIAIVITCAGLIGISALLIWLFN